MIVSITLPEKDAAFSTTQSQSIVEIASKFHSSAKIIAITGAGISVAAGIPDFRSSNGLYQKNISNPPQSCGNSQKSSLGVPGRALNRIKGKDMFDAAFLNDPVMRPFFYRFIAEMKDLINQARPTLTHKFLSRLAQQGKLLRWYTQNVDGLESLEEIKTDLIVPLHGTLHRVVCNLCNFSQSYDSNVQGLYQSGKAPTCNQCASRCADRLAKGYRPLKQGTMRPDIVLYNEVHPDGEGIAELLGLDMERRPTLLLVIGTSLKVLGLKRMVKDLAKTIRSRGGYAIYINKTPASRSEWSTVFNFELLGSCDQWVEIFSRGPKIISENCSKVANAHSDGAVTNSTKKNGRIDSFLRSVRKQHVDKVPKHKQNDC